MKLIELIKKQIIVVSAMVVLFLICLNTVLVFYNNWVLKEMTHSRQEAERATFLVSQIWNQVVRNIDVGMRGYALTKSEDLLGPLNSGIHDKDPIFKELNELTARQGFTRPETVDSIALAVNDFITATNIMVALARVDSTEQFKAALNADPGRSAWLIYDRNARVIHAFENDIIEHTLQKYEDADRNKLINQVILFLVSVPTLLFVIVRIRNDMKSRKNLFVKLEKNNRTYLFDPGTSADVLDENQVIDNSIHNFKKAKYFINNITNGNLEVQWDGITKGNEALNKESLAGELLGMRDKMKSIKTQDDIRNWTSEGLAKFSDVIRGNQESLQALCFDVLVYIVKYLKAQQGGIFVLTEDKEGNTYLELSASYAFDRKKFMEKKFEIGEGMVGQAFLEGNPVLLTQVPQGYTSITSGLGESTANCLLIVPMKYNEKIEAVIEIAALGKFEKHEIDLVEKIGEITASTLSTVKNTERMKYLVDQFKAQTEQLKSQEEELRQNMEEMEATQEAFRRQDKEDIQ